MEDLPITITDIAVIGVVFLSGFVAYLRGAVREFFFIATWGGAILATVYLYEVTLPWAKQWIEDPLFAAIANGTAIFLVTLILMTLVSSVFVKRSENSKLNALDRSLGFVFGLARGAFIVCLVYLLYALAAPPEQHPAWIQNARLTPLVAEGAEIMLAAVPDEWGLKGERVMQQLQDTSAAIDPFVDYDDLVEPEVDSEKATPAPESGYNEDDRSALDDKIQSQE